jgi:hypothetical protein
MLDSVLRTMVPVIVGVLLGQAARIGLDLPEGVVTEVVTVVATAAYYAVARWVEQTRPGVGRVLLSLGLSGKQPVYRSAAKRASR